MNKIIFILFFTCLYAQAFSQHHTEYYEDGAKLSKVTYVDGKFHGDVSFWYNNGNKQSKGEYKHGIPVGKHTEWHENTYLKSITYYDDKGRPMSYTEWNADQQKITEGKFLAGKEDGSWKHYDERGKLIKEDIFKEGQLVETKEH
jgi:antitoxin component YwqK of YwqJK toxin-antitoxin module